MRRIQWWRLVVLAGMCAVGLAAQADVMANLYEATIPVKSQERTDRDEAIRMALAEVLVRVSGRGTLVEAAEHPRIKAALVNATNYAQQFRFRERSAGKYSSSDSSFELWVKFDPVVVNKLLRDNGIPIWDKTRPGTLVWLVVDERGRREFFSQTTHHSARNLLEERALIRGMPVHLPYLDQTDRSVIQISDVWGNFAEIILRASQRYQQEAVLVGRILQEPSGLWGSRWTLYHEGRRQEWALNGVSLETAIALGVNHAADNLALRYAQLVHGEDTGVTVQVNALHSLADYHRVVKFLRSLTQVKAVDPIVVQPESATFKVTTTAGRLGLARAIALSKVLLSTEIDAPPPPPLVNPLSSPMPDPALLQPQAALSAELIYRLAP